MDMKKIIACAALVMGVVIFNGRLNAAVESDIVGYTTITMEAGKWYQVGTPFVALEEGVAQKLNDVFTEGFGAGDTLQVYNPDSSTYATYRWNTYKNGWAANTSPVATLSDVVLPTGQAVFINKKVQGDVVFSGKVSVEEAVTFGNENAASWSQFVCVYPDTVKLNGIAWSGLAAGDILQIYNADTATYATYRWNTYKNGWASNTSPVATLADVDVPAGQAFFVNKQTPGIGSCSYQ